MTTLGDVTPLGLGPGRWLTETTGPTDEAGDSAGHTVAEPEYLWPADRSWAVNTDYHLARTCIACSQATASGLLTEPALKILPVTRHTPTRNPGAATEDVAKGGARQQRVATHRRMAM